MALAPLTVAGCLGGDSDEVITAHEASVQTEEEVSVTGQVAALSTSLGPLTYAIVLPPSGGAVSLDASSGAFVYTPSVNFYGIDSFRFRAAQGRKESNVATVTITVVNRNDPPAIGLIDDAANQPDSLEVMVPVDISDPDPDPDSVSRRVAVADSSVALARFATGGDAVTLTPVARGVTEVTVTADDLEFQVTRTFRFEVRDVTRDLVLTSPVPAVTAIKVENPTGLTIDFDLVHNDARTFSTVAAIVQHVHDLPEDYPGEGFERKLWRFVRDTTYHEVPFNAEQWLYDPWPTIQSLGWGFCGHVAGAYVKLARAAGYEARVWGLNGHVVPEIQVDGAWKMFDPDVAVYYKKRDGSVAGVSDLVEDPSLIVEPFEPIFGSFSNFKYVNPYSSLIADIYSTADDNFTGNTFISPFEYPENRIELPPGAVLTYPGRWSSDVTGVDGDVPYVVRDYRQALLELPRAWTGPLKLPWMLWEVFGSGTILIDGVAYEVGSVALTSRIRETRSPVSEVEVVDGRDLQLAMFVNATQFHLGPVNHVALSGHAVGGLAVQTIELPAPNAAGQQIHEDLRKPRPLVP